ncbi:precorrin-2 dehydrogenase/sirohydrochlorin ferrochelatase family protein [Pelagibaculum spongiae]|uniref:precorrin-2 dehydrogenase n=1 Tax=Pelagibaculum spongiae TaxID=2080658 RepID=A0A2V1GXH2_9GAMM|nr:NAD(P)-dependent oxidoreductase [Pelagibaculum spongiae]PVZ71486.1 hypothetical protein DC094_00075 [Pelagibaculum spongiae]
MDFLPAFLDLKTRTCLVAGGGEVASRKLALLLRAGAKVIVVSPDINSEIQQFIDSGEKLYWHKKKFAAGDITAKTLVVAATSDSAVNQEISKLCQQNNIPVNVVDAPKLCSFIMPAIVDRSPILVAVASGGSAPVLARLIRSRIEALLPSSTGAMASLADKYRSRVKLAYKSLALRRRFWENAFEGKFAELNEKNLVKDAEELLVDQIGMPISQQGNLVLVKVFGQQADLFCFRALRLMQQADHVFYSENFPPELLDLVRRDAGREAWSDDSLANVFQRVDSNERVVCLIDGYSQVAGEIALETEKRPIDFSLINGSTETTVN